MWEVLYGYQIGDPTPATQGTGTGTGERSPADAAGGAWCRQLRTGAGRGATSSRTQKPTNTAGASNASTSATDLPASERSAPSAPPCPADSACVTRTSSPAEKICLFRSLFRSLFRGRADAYALRWHSEKTQKSGYSPVCANEWQPGLCEKGRVSCAKCANRALRPLDDAALYRHLAGRDAHGRDVIGLYPMLPDETCYLLALDFDDANWQDCAHAVAGVCRAHGIPFALERSRSGQGAHVWLFFAEAIPCAKARQLGDALLTAAMDACGGISFAAYDRMFPNQDTLPAGGFGNLIALPLQGQARRQGNSVFLDDSLTPYLDPWAFLSTVRTLLPVQVDALLAELCQSRPALGALAERTETADTRASHANIATTASSSHTPWKPALAPTLSAQDFKQLPLPIVRANGLYIQTEHLSPKARNQLIRLAAFRNPDFYKKQAMHFSTHNIPRILSTAMEADGFLVLPRGCEEALCALLQDAGTNYTIQDETCPGRPLRIAFTGALRPDQQPAADALLAHRNGVLSATTAFGKTVVAAWLIAQRGVSTLILVHTQALLNQWQAALAQFLQIDEQLPPQPKHRGRQRKRSLIGQLCGGKHTAAGFVDIAMLQSLVHGGEIDPRVREYGLVIVDECHHVSAAGFEQVLRAVPARNVYGLTATPARADGHGPIIAMQCGPIRYEVSAKAQAERQGFARIVVPRFTRFAMPLTIEKPTYGKICDALIQDTLRNALIVQDACDLLAQERTPLLLTERLDHAKILAAALRPHCPHVFLLSGRGTAKEKHALLDALAAVPAGVPLAVVAIGKYAGEGFDLPRLDALLLTMPVAWKGTLTQYTGRLHRAAPGKREVLLYDYVDIRVPMLEQQYRRRLHSYAALAYTVRGAAGKSGSGKHPAQSEAAVFVSCEQFPQRFAEDLKAATREVLFCAPSLSARSVQRMIPLLQCVQHQGGNVQVCLPDSAQFRADIQPKIAANAAALQRSDIPVAFCPNHLPNFCVIDQRLVWYGGLNPLGQMPTDGSSLRMDAPDVAAELVEVLRGVMPNRG